MSGCAELCGISVVKTSPEIRWQPGILPTKPAPVQARARPTIATISLDRCGRSAVGGSGHQSLAQAQRDGVRAVTCTEFAVQVCGV